MWVQKVLDLLIEWHEAKFSCYGFQNGEGGKEEGKGGGKRKILADRFDATTRSIKQVSLSPHTNKKKVEERLSRRAAAISLH